MARTLTLLAGCLLVALPVPAPGQDPDAERARVFEPLTAPDTGIYVEADYRDGKSRCDWYFAARQVLTMAPPKIDTPCPVIIRLRGALTPRGARQFVDLSEALADWPAIPVRIVLNSPGGDMDAALWIGRAIRRYPVYRQHEAGVATAIDEASDAVCLSACVIVFAAGFQREARFDIASDPPLPSRLGVHRPGLFNRRDLVVDSDPAQRDLVYLREQLIKYFADVGVSAAIVETMFAVPHEELHLLTEDEARAWGLVHRVR